MIYGAPINRMVNDVNIISDATGRFLSNDITITATGTTNVIDTDGFAYWTWQYVANGTGASIKFEGSIDGTNFFVLDEVTHTTTTSEMRHVVFKPVKYVRFNITSLGSATTIKIKCFGVR